MSQLVKERPILFSAPMVRAIRDGSKTQTRRIIKAPWLSGEYFYSGEITTDLGYPESQGNVWVGFRHDPQWQSCDPIGSAAYVKCPQGKVGDRLWGRETHYIVGESRQVFYRADDSNNFGDPFHWHGGWKPSIFMPRWASRIDLEITGIRVERLQDISEEDAKAEGAPGYEEGIDSPPPEDGEYSWSHIASFRSLWRSINGHDSWGLNPWVWVLEFKRIEAEGAKP